MRSLQYHTQIIEDTKFEYIFNDCSNLIDSEPILVSIHRDQLAWQYDR